MLTIVLAVGSALAYGSVDFLGGVASKKVPPILVTALSHVASALLLAASLLFIPLSRGLVPAEIGWAMFSGLGSGLGVMFLYEGFARGKMGVVSSVAAAIGGSTPALFDLIRGADVSPLGLVGLALALVAAVIVSRGVDAPGDDHPDPATAHAQLRSAVLFGILSGVCFASGLVGYDFLASAGAAAGGEVGALPLVVARSFSGLALLTIAKVRIGRLVMSRRALLLTLGAGAFDALGNILLFGAVARGPLVVASPLQSLYPIPTMILARIFLSEKLHGIQLVGILIALAAILLASIG